MLITCKHIIIAYVNFVYRKDLHKAFNPYVSLLTILESISQATVTHPNINNHARNHKVDDLAA